ncbi:MAG: hypothetical protein D6681_13850, partial [Calditrichaeota bacterium]
PEGKSCFPTARLLWIPLSGRWNSVLRNKAVLKLKDRIFHRQDTQYATANSSLGFRILLRTFLINIITVD